MVCGKTDSNMTTHHAIPQIMKPIRNRTLILCEDCHRKLHYNYYLNGHPEENALRYFDHLLEVENRIKKMIVKLEGLNGKNRRYNRIRKW